MPYAEENVPFSQSKANEGLRQKKKRSIKQNNKYRKQKWGPNTSENSLFVRSGLIQRLQGERGELRREHSVYK